MAATLGEPVEGNEFIRRTEIQEQQPDILVTNYKQLEFLLVRKEDRTLFSPSLRFLVLDEIHSYRGALATEIACLIRRLKARTGVGEGKLRCIGTSATVSKDAGGDEALGEFAASLFGEPFSREDVIGETLVVKPPPSRTYQPPFAKLTAEEIQNFDHEDDAKLAELVARITGQSLSLSGSMPQKIRAALEGNQLVALLERECREPRSLGELIEVLKTSPEAAKALTEQELRTLIETHLLVGSVGTEKDPPSLRPKLHTFFQGVYDVGLCMNPACRTLVRDGSETCPKCQSAVQNIRPRQEATARKPNKYAVWPELRLEATGNAFDPGLRARSIGSVLPVSPPTIDRSFLFPMAKISRTPACRKCNFRCSTKG